MKTAAKRTRASTSTSKHKTVTKVASKKSMTRQRKATAGAQQRKPAPKPRRRTDQPKSSPQAPTRSTPTTKAVKQGKLRRPATALQPTRSQQEVRAQKAQGRMSAQAKKNLVARHLRKLLEEKKRRAAQPPAWQQIAHHDHPAPAGAQPSPQLVGNGLLAIRGSRDRGGD